MKKIYSMQVLWLVLALVSGCSDPTPQPEVTIVGSQDPDEVDDEVTSVVGRALNYMTGEGIEGVQVRSFAPSDAVLSREGGAYALVRNVRAGEVYEIQAAASGFGDAFSSVLTSERKEANVDLFMLPEANLLPVVLEPSSIIFDHTTHTISARMRNSADEALYWCASQSPELGSFVFPDGGRSKKVFMEPSRGVLAHDASVLLRFTLPDQLFSSLQRGTQGIETLRALLLLTGGVESLGFSSVSEACTTETVARETRDGKVLKSALLPLLAIRETSNAYTIRGSLENREGVVCLDFFGDDEACSITQGESASLVLRVHDQGQQAVQGTRVRVRFEQEGEGAEPLVEVVVVTDLNGEARVELTEDVNGGRSSLSGRVMLAAYDGAEEEGARRFGVLRTFDLRVSPNSVETSVPDALRVLVGSSDATLAELGEGDPVQVAGNMGTLRVEVRDALEDGSGTSEIWRGDGEEVVRVRAEFETKAGPEPVLEVFSGLEADAEGWFSLPIQNGVASTQLVNIPPEGRIITLHTELLRTRWNASPLREEGRMVFGDSEPDDIALSFDGGASGGDVVELLEEERTDVVLEDATRLDVKVLDVEDSPDNTWEGQGTLRIRAGSLTEAEFIPLSGVFVDFVEDADGWVTFSVVDGIASLSTVLPEEGEFTFEVEMDRTRWLESPLEEIRNITATSSQTPTFLADVEISVLDDEGTLLPQQLTSDALFAVPARRMQLDISVFEDSRENPIADPRAMWVGILSAGGGCLDGVRWLDGDEERVATLESLDGQLCWYRIVLSDGTGRASWRFDGPFGRASAEGELHIRVAPRGGEGMLNDAVLAESFPLSFDVPRVLMLTVEALSLEDDTPFDVVNNVLTVPSRDFRLQARFQLVGDLRTGPSDLRDATLSDLEESLGNRVDPDRLEDLRVEFGIVPSTPQEPTFINTMFWVNGEGSLPVSEPFRADVTDVVNGNDGTRATSSVRVAYNGVPASSTGDALDVQARLLYGETSLSLTSGAPLLIEATHAGYRVDLNTRVLDTEWEGCQRADALFRIYTIDPRDYIRQSVNMELAVLDSGGGEIPELTWRTEGVFVDRDASETQRPVFDVLTQGTFDVNRLPLESSGRLRLSVESADGIPVDPVETDLGLSSLPEDQQLGVTFWTGDDLYTPNLWQPLGSSVTTAERVIVRVTSKDRFGCPNALPVHLEMQNSDSSPVSATLQTSKGTEEVRSEPRVTGTLRFYGNRLEESALLWVNNASTLAEIHAFRSDLSASPVESLPSVSELADQITVRSSGNLDPFDINEPFQISGTLDTALPGMSGDQIFLQVRPADSNATCVYQRGDVCSRLENAMSLLPMTEVNGLRSFEDVALSAGQKEHLFGEVGPGEYRLCMVRVADGLTDLGNVRTACAEETIRVGLRTDPSANNTFFEISNFTMTLHQFETEGLKAFGVREPQNVSDPLHFSVAEGPCSSRPDWEWDTQTGRPGGFPVSTAPVGVDMQGFENISIRGGDFGRTFSAVRYCIAADTLDRAQSAPRASLRLRGNPIELPLDLTSSGAQRDDSGWGGVTLQGDVSAIEPEVSFPMWIALVRTLSGTCNGSGLATSDETIRVETAEDLMNGFSFPPESFQDDQIGDSAFCVCGASEPSILGVRRDVCALARFSDLDATSGGETTISLDDGWGNIHVDGQVGMIEEPLGFHLRRVEDGQCTSLLARSMTALTTSNSSGVLDTLLPSNAFPVAPQDMDDPAELNGALCLCLSDEDNTPIVPEICSIFTGVLN